VVTPTQTGEEEIMADAETAGRDTKRDDKGQFVAAGPTPDADAQTVEATTSAPAVEPSDEEKKQAAYLAEAKDERSKRQKAQEEAAYWRGQAEANARAHAQANEPKPEDLDLEFMANPSKSVRSAVEQAKWETKVELTQDAERDKHPDYDEKEAIFGRNVPANSPLRGSPEYQRNPAKFAYKWASDFLAPKGSDGSSDELKKEIAELRATVAKLTGAPADQIPQTKAGARSVSGNTAPDDQEDWLAEATRKRNGKIAF
jgi:hypothetical protein